MSTGYITDSMSARAKTLYERGRFFIESGGAPSFRSFINMLKFDIIGRYMPDIVIKRIVDLINTGDTDRAVTLWMRVCAEADSMPSRTRKVALFYLSYAVIAIMALYAFVNTFFNY
jgi:hypothetical protein